MKKLLGALTDPKKLFKIVKNPKVLVGIFERGHIAIDGHQIVLSARLDAMARIVDQCHVGLVEFDVLDQALEIAAQLTAGPVHGHSRDEAEIT